MKNHKLTSDDFEILDVKLAYQGFFQVQKLQLRHRLFDGGYSKPINRELFTRGSAAGVILYDPINRLIGMVEQFRVGALNEAGGPWLYEVIAGMIDENSDPVLTARKELEEEAGVTGVVLHSIGDYLVSPGGTDEKMFLFCGVTNLIDAQGLFGVDAENEDIRFHVLEEDNVFADFDRGFFNNAATMIALLWLQQHKSSL